MHCYCPKNSLKISILWLLPFGLFVAFFAIYAYKKVDRYMLNKVIRCLEGATAYVFASSGCKKWDTAAPEAVLVAAGGSLTDLSGRPIRYERSVQLPNSGGILATAPGVDHQPFVTAIPQHIKDALPEQLPSDTN